MLEMFMTNSSSAIVFHLHTSTVTRFLGTKEKIGWMVVYSLHFFKQNCVMILVLISIVEDFLSFVISVALPQSCLYGIISCIHNIKLDLASSEMIYEYLIQSTEILCIEICKCS